jgi:capsid protein
MSFIEQTIRFFSPATALQRQRAKAQLEAGDKVGYWRVGAQSSTNRRASGQTLDQPDSSRNHTDRVTLIREARWLEENSSVVKSILRKYRTFSVGRLQYVPRTSSEEANKAITAYVERWMASCDLTRRHHFRVLAGLGVTSMKRDGDIGYIVSEVPMTPLDEMLKISPIRLQAIEADRIGSIPNRNGTDTKPFKPLKRGEQDFSGVVIDSMGRPIRYRIYNRSTTGEMMMPALEVPAQEFLHLFDPTRLDSYRGFSAFDAAITDIKDLQEILACEKISVKYLSSISGVINNADGSADQDVSLDTTHSDYMSEADRLKKVEPGAIQYLAEGESFNPVDFNRPSPTFNGFLDTLVRSTGLTVGLPFGFIYNWAGQGTAVRMEAAQAAREFEMTQLTLEEKFLYPIVMRVIARGIQLGHLPAVADFDAGEWRFPAKVTADIGRESKALIDETMAGIISKTQIAADRGEDRNIIRSLLRAEAMELVEDAKMVQDASGGVLDLPTAIYMLERRAPNAPAIPAPAAPAPEMEDSPEDDVEDAAEVEDEASPEDIAEDEAEAGSTD